MRKGKASPVERTVHLTDQTEHQSTQGREQGGVLSTKCVKPTLVTVKQLISLKLKPRLLQGTVVSPPSPALSTGIVPLQCGHILTGNWRSVIKELTKLEA